MKEWDKNVFEEVMAENFPHLNKETDVQVKEADRVPNKINRKGLTPRYIIIKLTKVKAKERILKVEKIKKTRVISMGILIRLPTDFSAESLQARKQWHDTFKVLKGKELQPRILYPAQSFRIEFLREAKLKEV